jgi:hypothetical protein
MRRKTLARYGGGWSHPYGHSLFSPSLYADGGDSDDGAGGDGDSTGASDDAAADDAGTGGAGDSASKSKGATQGGTDDSAAKIARLEKDLADARKDAGKARTDAKKQAADEAVKAVTQKLGKALGLVEDDGPPDPEALTKALAAKEAALTERDVQLRAKDVELAVHGRAGKAGAKADALLDSRSFLAAIKDLDPAEKGFGAALDDAIKKALKDNPAYAVAAAGRSGGDHNGSAGESGAAKAARPTSLSAAVRGSFGT